MEFQLFFISQNFSVTDKITTYFRFTDLCMVV